MSEKKSGAPEPPTGDPKPPTGDPKPPLSDRETARRELRRNQVFGVILGLIGGWMTGNFWPVLPASITWGGVLLWGAAIGAIIGSLTQFERAGKVLTRADNRVLNLAVGLAVPLLLILVLALIFRAAQ